MKDTSQLQFSSLSAWLRMISFAASEEQPYDYRLAAAKSIRSTNLLHSFVNGTLTKVLSDRRIITLLMSMLLICSELLQDDDDDVRLCMNEHLCMVLNNESVSSQTTTVVSNFVLLRFNMFSILIFLCRRIH